ncbi:LPS export ABC transporter permease LptF [Acinetobacter rudis]|uniref:Lipopolysaccharide export system permease protein LptF n=1 Tax=Acinetobacter rudis TaxID=632955 RepID=A0AAW8J967_9GAMM|nr:LPS export ABC transporter permease LptF [Acinetobacter rudis]MDQ8934179.1 LPS export ABC transporter permease LptF [Acinetobacter rudis]MDQ8952664.1 LPS export ABC transporter permease LptF [Acinetobacter rudis]MDQ9016513.1 LPS export ABC transporter permease LptF [Acinetobacter rudis]
MIIRRYLFKQVMATTLVVVSLLTLIILGARLIKYFGLAAQGNLDVSILFSIIGFRLPEFLILILPLGFFIALMLVFGRLYVDHEMAVLNGSGVSKHGLARLLIPTATAFLIAHMLLLMWVSPWGLRQFHQLYSTQSVRAGFDLVRPQEFIQAGSYTIYAGSLSQDRKNLKDIFIYQRADRENRPDTMILAKEATRIETSDSGASVVDLIQGRRYEIQPDTAKYTKTEFQTYRIRIQSDKEASYSSNEVEGLTMSALWEGRANPVVLSELGWRIFMPFSMFVALILTVGLSEVTPRQGRYIRLFPAILIFASMVVCLIAIKTRMSKGQVGVWAYPAVLFVYAIFGAIFSRKQKFAPKIKKRIQRARS